MICGHCGDEVARDPCPACGHDTRVGGRYRLEAIVGRGAAGITYRAVRLEDGLTVAIKEMPFHRIDAEKIRDLYVREARVLRELDHPAIPAYVDDFVAGEGRHRSLYLAQTFIDGETLAAEAADRRYREEEVLAIVAEVARILVYLHDLRPPVIHRDIKPGNLMRRAADGALVLVDFGAVRDALADPAMGGSTVVGTYGFMAPEQYRGDAGPGTDLYALGVTAAVLLSRLPAEALSEVPGRVDWQRHLDVHPATAALLDDLVEPDVGRRLDDARQVVARAEQAIDAILRDREAEARAPAFTPDPPAISAGGFDFGPAHEAGGFDDSPPPEIQRRGGGGSVMAVVLGAFVAALAVVVGIISAVGDRSRAVGDKAYADTRCGGATCRAPHGLKGLDFGMTVEQARAALPELADATLTRHTESKMDTAAVLGSTSLLDAMLTVETPGPTYVVSTRIGAFDASCRLHFAVRETLSSMACTFGKQPDLATHQGMEEALVGALRGRYGVPAEDERPSPPAMMGIVQRDRAVVWRDDAAEARLESHFKDLRGMTGMTGLGGLEIPPDSTLSLTNTSTAHQQAIEAAEAAARRASEERRRARAREAAAEADEARRLIERSKGRLDDDL